VTPPGARHLLVLPDTDGELHTLLCDLDDVVHASMGDVQVDAFGRLGQALDWGRQDAPVLPVHAGTELGPLWFFDVDTRDLVRFGAPLTTTLLSRIEESWACRPVSMPTCWARSDLRPAELLARAARLFHLLHLDLGPDAEGLRPLLDGRRGQRVELSDHHHAIYRRVVSRVLHAWAPRDPLARFAMLGTT
jgi:hypothetical protein